MNLNFWISFYMLTPETMISMPGVKRSAWRYLTAANPYVIIQWVLLDATNEADARDKIVAHYGLGVVWRRCWTVPESFEPPRHEDLV